MGKKSMTDVRLPLTNCYQNKTNKKAENNKNAQPKDVSIWDKAKTWVKEKI